jgi:PAS domain S-box-containing protein
VESPIVRGIAHDVTEQRRTEKRLREVSESLLDKVRDGERTIRELKLFRSLVDQSNESIKVIDPETLRLLDVNDKTCAELGYSREELLSLRVFDIDLEITESSVVKIKQELWKSGFLVMERVHRRKDGSTFPVEVSMRLVQLERDYVITISRNLTEARRTEARLREYQRVVEGLEEMMVVVDRDYRYVIANRAFLSYRNLEKEQVIGHLVAEVIDPGVFETAVKPKIDECFRGKVVQFELKYTYPKRGERDLHLSYFPIEGSDGIDRIAAVLRDITERKRAEEALRRSEENYRNFVSQSSEGIYQDDLDPAVPINLPEDEFIHRFLRSTVMVDCNNALAAMYGFASAEELRGRKMSERVLAEDPRNIEMVREFIHSGFRLQEHESHEVDRHGNPKIFLNSMIGTVEDGRLVHIWGIRRDITEKVKLEESRQRAEESLHENVAQLQGVTEELRLAKEKLAEEKLYLEQAIDTELGFGEIIGRSSALKEVMEKVAKVAPSDATVLLLGETGTGKELVARAIHRLSQREGNSFIKLNCAAIPSGLLESELFGHEKGAFTGAVARKLGRLELADRGTLFLDEVGEIPLSLQPKLLRILQDLEFERLGGTQTLKVNFRLLAATNRDLLHSVKEREFRSDLYYRLNVFPIMIPPLRERREDIRPLVEHFVRKFAAQMKKSITSIPSRTMEMMVRWSWPGNIRELENFVERSVILTPGSVLQAPLAELQTVVEQGDAGSRGLREKESDRILRALRDCHGKLGGPDGAAARLGLKRTTLQSKLDQLGIKPGSYRP